MSTKVDKEFEEVSEWILQRIETRNRLKRLGPDTYVRASLQATAQGILNCIHTHGATLSADKLITLLGGIEGCLALVRSVSGLDRKTVLQAKTSQMKKKFPALRKVGSK